MAQCQYCFAGRTFALGVALMGNPPVLLVLELDDSILVVVFVVAVAAVAAVAVAVAVMLLLLLYLWKNDMDNLVTCDLFPYI